MTTKKIAPPADFEAAEPEAAQPDHDGTSEWIDPEPSMVLQKRHPEKNSGCPDNPIRFFTDASAYCGGCGGFSSRFRSSS
jgi:hypothetical protein